MTPTLPQDWAYIDPVEYFAWHRDFGVNIFFLQGYLFCGYAYYPTKLGPIAPGPAGTCFPNSSSCRKRQDFHSAAIFPSGMDLIASNLRNEWVVPTSRNYTPWGLLAPESPWTDLLCARVTEFLKLYPVEWINFDCFNYGKYNSNDFPVQPSPFVKGPFKEIIGRDMPEKASEITPEESLKYKREIMARQFYRIREAMHKGNPGTKANFNVPFFKPAEPMWVDHPMVNECDQLVAESTDEVMNWLLKIRKPHQRVMTTIIGRPNDKGVCDPNTWRKWYEAGCDFFGYAHGTPPDFRPQRFPPRRRWKSFAKLIARCLDLPADGHPRTGGEKRPRGRPGALSSGLSRRPPSPHAEGRELCNDEPFYSGLAMEVPVGRKPGTPRGWVWRAGGNS